MLSAKKIDVLSPILLNTRNCFFVSTRIPVLSKRLAKRGPFCQYAQPTFYDATLLATVNDQEGIDLMTVPKSALIKNPNHEKQDALHEVCVAYANRGYVAVL